MLVPCNWLKQYVDISGYDAQSLGDTMTMSGSNVEQIKYLGEGIDDKVVTGKIEEIKSHPNADKLKICKVNISKDIVQIITGADNIKEGDIVPIALEGSVLPIGTKIATAEFRGEKSQGMMCSAQELKMDMKIIPENQQDGILILPEDTPVGEKLKDVLELDDFVIEFEITSNRPDCLSIIGMARETAATLKRKIKYPQIKIPRGKGNVKDMVDVVIEDEDLCPRYTARIIDNVKIKPSPLWMQNRLRACGIRPINNIVDITNYVMLEYGQPLHAFDYTCLEGRKIIVRRAGKGEKITTLDGKERILGENTLVIADTKKPVGIAGVMGGLNSEITENTKTVLLESANFYHGNIRETSKKMTLRTEASSRFEKGIDPEIAMKASERFIQLVEELGAGEVIDGVIDVYPGKRKPNSIKMRFDRVNKILGIKISPENMIDILKSLEIRIIENTEDYIIVEPPTFRRDLKREADLVEEIARLYGYDKIEPTLPFGETTLGKIDYHDQMVNKVKYILNSCGINEITTFSFIGPKDYEKIGLDPNKAKAIKIKNPLGEDQSLMRTTLLPSMLNIIVENYNKKIENIRFFEVSNVYIPKDLPLTQLPEEEKVLSIGMMGDCDFYSIKGVVETILENLKIKYYKFLPYQHTGYHPGRTAVLQISGENVGVIGEIHPDVLENYNLPERAYAGEIKLEKLIEYANLKYRYKPLPKYPAVNRDIALLVKEDVLVDTVKELIYKTGGSIIEHLELFDVYKGEQIPEGYKSLAFSIKYRSHEKTLTDEEVNVVHDKIIEVLEEEIDAKLRM